MEQDIGKKIHALRRAKRLTLEELGKRTGYTASFLSQLERGLCSISLTSLDKIAKELGVSLVSFFPQERRNRYMTSDGDRQMIRVDNSLIQYEHLSGDFPGRILDAYLVTVMPGNQGDDGQAWSHQGEEIGFVLKGTLHMNVNKEEHVLGPGASIHFPSHLPHVWHNRGKEPVLLVVVTTQRII